MSSDILSILVLIVVSIVILSLAVWVILRWRYVNSLRKRGWSFDTSPTIDNMIGLNHAPFGAGFERKVDDMIYGRAANGVEFKAIEYEYQDWKSDKYVVILPIPRPLPFLYLRPANIASRIPNPPSGHQFTLGTHAVNAAAEQYGREIGAAIAAQLGPIAQHEVSVDHANFVIFNVGPSPCELQAAIDAGADIVQMLADVPQRYSAAPAPNHLSFNHRPNWGYLPRADDYLTLVPYTGGGRNHRALNVVYGERDHISFVRLEHRWETQRTDSNGRAHTVRHLEYCGQFRLGFAFQQLDVGSGIFGFFNDKSGIQFESADFNKAYKVTAGSQKFAYDVLHPRMMQWLLEIGAPRFEFHQDGRVELEGYSNWTLEDLAAADAFLHDFFARVPDFVWDNLGVEPRPIREHQW